MTIREKNPELFAGIEYKFWIWMTKQGAFMNLKLELSKYGLSYDDMVEAMCQSYLKDFYKSAYFKPFTAFLLFEQKEEPVYTKKYWETLEVLWKKYAKGETAT